MSKVYACLAVTCHLHVWQNDRDLLRATAVTLGWNGYRSKSQHRKYLHNVFNPRFDYCARKVCSSPATFHTLKSISSCQMSFTSLRKQHLDDDD